MYEKIKLYLNHMNYNKQYKKINKFYRILYELYLDPVIAITKLLK